MRIRVITDYGLPCVPVGEVFEASEATDGRTFIHCRCSLPIPFTLYTRDYEILPDTPEVFSDGLENWE